MLAMLRTDVDTLMTNVTTLSKYSMHPLGNLGRVDGGGGGGFWDK